jgi:hypothetical protein
MFGMQKGISPPITESQESIQLNPYQIIGVLRKTCFKNKIDTFQASS